MKNTEDTKINGQRIWQTPEQRKWDMVETEAATENVMDSEAADKE
jgi:hypothetical protein